MSAAVLRIALADFNNADAFFDHLHEDVIVEFPYGPTLALPARIEGKTAVQAHLSAVQSGGLTVHDPTIQQVTPNRHLVEYTGTYRSPSGAPISVPLVAVIDQHAQRIHRIREYWDTLLLATLSGEAERT